jgi:hypothetical protein
MTDWIFLIQKEGDRCWQPIPTPRLDVEECRYRIIAQNDVTDLCVEIRINVEPFAQSSCSQERQTYFRRTNSQGLIIIVPFTYLFAGLWTFSCCCDPMSELLGETWQVSQQILSLPKTSYYSPSNTYTTPCPQETVLDLPQPVPPQKSLANKILPPKLSLTSPRVLRKSPQLPRLPS